MKIYCTKCKQPANWNTSFDRPSKLLCHACYEQSVNKLVKAGKQKPAAQILVFNSLFKDC